jgi:DNA-3-methyladenine glycosylase II
MPSDKGWSEGTRHLRRVDPVLRKIIDKVGPCTVAPRRDYFVVLCKAIFNQQPSTAVAATLFGRFRDLFPMRRPTPGLTIRMLEGSGAQAAVRACGLSRQKAAYLLDLARHFQDGEIATRRLSAMDDEAVIDALVGVHGIGRWTAEMFLIFTLNRPDVLPVDDLGLREAVRDVYKLPNRPTPKEVVARGEIWRPYRSLATWYLWRRNTRLVAPNPRARSNAL